MYDDRPTSRALLESIPESVLDTLRIAIAPRREQAHKLEAARLTDRMFGGAGRYEWEVWQRLAIDTEQPEPETIRRFRSIAIAQGVDADAVLAALLWPPTLVLSPQARDYGPTCS